MAFNTNPFHEQILAWLTQELVALDKAREACIWPTDAEVATYHAYHTPFVIYWCDHCHQNSLTPCHHLGEPVSESRATLTLDNTTVRLNAQEVKEAVAQLGFVITKDARLLRCDINPGEFFCYEGYSRARFAVYS